MSLTADRCECTDTQCPHFAPLDNARCDEAATCLVQIGDDRDIYAMCDYCAKETITALEGVKIVEHFTPDTETHHEAR